MTVFPYYRDIQLTSTHTYSTDTNLSEYTSSSDRDSPQINKKDDDSDAGTMV